jgi:hypothetical protein
MRGGQTRHKKNRQALSGAGGLVWFGLAADAAGFTSCR